MEYEKIDETTRREACENVKKIAEAIKKIRKKYYLCFDKISDADRKRYDELKAQMQSIANENGLNKLSEELISDINRQYSENLPDDKDEKGMPSNNSIEGAYQMYLKAVQLLAEFTVQLKNTKDLTLEKACMKRILKIQAYIKELCEFLESSYSKNKLNNDKRNILSVKFTEHSKEYFNKLFANCYKSAKEPIVKKETYEILQGNDRQINQNNNREVVFE